MQLSDFCEKLGVRSQKIWEKEFVSQREKGNQFASNYRLSRNLKVIIGILPFLQILKTQKFLT